MDERSLSNYYGNQMPDQQQKTDEDYVCYLCDASYEKELLSDWTSLFGNELTPRSESENLQLAAELGKTLLERNKELETSVKNYQDVVEEQREEIRYLTKQTAALKEVNDSRLRIYENLEISIQELERANLALNQSAATDKKQIKNFLTLIENLEHRCEKLQKRLDETTLELERERRRCSVSFQDVSSTTDGLQTPSEEKRNAFEIKTLSSQVQEARSTLAKEQRKNSELQQQLNLLALDNKQLEDSLSVMQQREEDMKHAQDELATLNKIRKGTLCKRCLRSTVHVDDCSSADEFSDTERNAMESMIVAQRDEVLLHLQKSLLENGCENPYRVLVDKYEALLKIQMQEKLKTRPTINSGKSRGHLSLQEELQMSGHFHVFQRGGGDSDAETSGAEDKRKSLKAVANDEKGAALTMEEGDRTTKCTQTEIHALPGSFLCKISDGTDCQFSIYDDASPIESRFRKTPEYRQLFREIFQVLKRAAEAKDEGEALPLLEDTPRVPPATPAVEEKVFGDAGLREEKADRKMLEEEGGKKKLARVGGDSLVNSPAASPRKKRNRSKARRKFRDLSGEVGVVGSPNRSRERHQQRSSWSIFPELERGSDGRPISMYEGFGQGQEGGGACTASQEVAKLKILEKSYAEVLRMGRMKKQQMQQVKEE